MNLNRSLTNFAKNCDHSANSVCKTCAIAWSQQQNDKLEKARRTVLEKLSAIKTTQVNKEVAGIIFDCVTTLKFECPVCWYPEGFHEAECPDK